MRADVPMRHLARCIVEPSQEALQTVQLENVESSTGRLIGTLVVTEPAGQNRFRPGDVLFSKLRPYLAKSLLVAEDLQGSGEFLCLRPSSGLDSSYLVYLTLSRPWLEHAVMTSYGTKMPRSSWEQMSALRVPHHPLDEQRRIADFLDDRVARIDQIIAARRWQLEAVAELQLRQGLDVVSGREIETRKSTSRLAWLGSLPADWPVLPVSTQFEVDLGKMLDEKRQTGTASIPYLRNTNVQWDRIDDSDLKEMDIHLDERSRYTVTSGDLLVCEGGQPGRAAIWDGRVTPMGYQKALHRVRTRGRSRPEWLLECLRVAVHLNVFLVESGQTTIAHLTNEQLRSQHFPFPDPRTQKNLLDELAHQRESITKSTEHLQRSITLLTEYKSSLITAAVTGELDVTTASRRTPGE